MPKQKGWLLCREHAISFLLPLLLFLLARPPAQPVSAFPCPPPFSALPGSLLDFLLLGHVRSTYEYCVGCTSAARASSASPSHSGKGRPPSMWHERASPLLSGQKKDVHIQDVATRPLSPTPHISLRHTCSKRQSTGVLSGSHATLLLHAPSLAPPAGSHTHPSPPLSFSSRLG